MKRIIVFDDVMVSAQLELGDEVELVRGNGPRDGETIGVARVILAAGPGNGQPQLALDAGPQLGIWPLGPPLES